MTFSQWYTQFKNRDRKAEFRRKKAEFNLRHEIEQNSKTNQPEENK